MVRVQCSMEDQWMPKLAPDLELVLVNITTRIEAARSREVLKQKPTITKEEVLHAKYLDPMHQKEVYQETMEVIHNLQ
ncbi:hypothetical protein KI387_025167, partial [Taxus chinensis]